MKGKMMTVLTRMTIPVIPMAAQQKPPTIVDSAVTIACAREINDSPFVCVCWIVVRKRILRIDFAHFKHANLSFLGFIAAADNTTTFCFPDQRLHKWHSGHVARQSPFPLHKGMFLRPRCTRSVNRSNSCSKGCLNSMYSVTVPSTLRTRYPASIS